MGTRGGSPGDLSPSFTHGTWRHLLKDSVRTELNCRAPSWCHRALPSVGISRWGPAGSGMESSVWTGKEAHRKDLWGVSRHRRMTTGFFHTQRENKKGKPKEQKTRGEKKHQQRRRAEEKQRKTGVGQGKRPQSGCHESSGTLAPHLECSTCSLRLV